jgi:hypothetical protein
VPDDPTRRPTGPQLVNVFEAYAVGCWTRLSKVERLWRKVLRARRRQVQGDDRDSKPRRLGRYRDTPSSLAELPRCSTENGELRIRLAGKVAPAPHAVLQLQTKEAQIAKGRLQAVQPLLRYEPNPAYPGIPAAPEQRNERAQRSDKLDDEFSRLVWITLRVHNSGGDAARAVRARFRMAPVEPDGNPGIFGRVLVGRRRSEARALLSERGGHVYIESAEKDPKGELVVIQRILSVGAGCEERLIRMGVFLPRNEARECATQVAYELTEEGGARCCGAFRLSLRHEGEFAGTWGDIRQRINSPRHTTITSLDG